MNKTIVLGGGCFWCVEAAFKQLEGVEKVTSGYAGGHVENPSYEEVCTRKTGHAEVVKVRFNENGIDLETILELFFKIHNPTTKDREGPDEGSQYRSIILYDKKDQEKIIERFIQKKREEYSEKIVTEVKPLEKFYPAEKKHQDYFEKNPNDSYCHIYARPKVEKANNFKDEYSPSN